MTIAEARRAIAGRLRFGDENQIKAVDFLARVEAAVEALRVCPHGAAGDCEECDGEGEVECDLGHMHDCEECEGTGKSCVSCECVTGIPDDVTEAARTVVREDQVQAIARIRRRAS